MRHPNPISPPPAVHAEECFFLFFHLEMPSRPPGPSCNVAPRVRLGAEQSVQMRELRSKLADTQSRLAVHQPPLSAPSNNNGPVAVSPAPNQNNTPAIRAPFFHEMSQADKAQHTKRYRQAEANKYHYAYVDPGRTQPRPPVDPANIPIPQAHHKSHKKLFLIGGLVAGAVVVIFVIFTVLSHSSGGGTGGAKKGGGGSGGSGSSGSFDSCSGSFNSCSGSFNSCTGSFDSCSSGSGSLPSIKGAVTQQLDVLGRAAAAAHPDGLADPEQFEYAREQL